MVHGACPRPENEVRNLSVGADSNRWISDNHKLGFLLISSHSVSDLPYHSIIQWSSGRRNDDLELSALSLVSHEEVYGKVNSTCVADDKQSARILHINPMDYGLTFYIRPNERGTQMAHKLLSVNYSHIIVLDMSQSEKMCDLCQYPNWSSSRSRRH